MRFIRVDLTGYIGIYSPMGLETMSVDFTNSKFPICIVAGPNGMGKSTFLKSLTVFPDSNDRFVPHMVAIKHLVLTNGNNLYEINIVHDLDSHGNRKTPKVSILKDGTELNPNGNVSSYKEIILNEFGIDTNYTTLCSISGEDKGLSGKTPAERKKILASIISSLDVYNEIYKTLNKKSIVLKNQLKSISDKIQSIGDSNNISQTLSRINIRLEEISNLSETYKAEMVKAKTIVDMTDPNNKLQDEINIWTERKNADMIELKNISYEDTEDISSPEAYENAKKKYEVSKEAAISKRDSIKEDITKYTERSNYLSNTLNDISVRKSKLVSVVDNNFESTINTLKENNRIIEEELASNELEGVTKNDYEIVVKVLDTFMDAIEDIYSNNTVEDIALAMTMDDNELITKTNELSEAKGRKMHILNDIHDLEKDMELVSTTLKNRPKGCKIDSCPFIEEALKIKKKYKSQLDMDEKMVQLTSMLSEVDKNITFLVSIVEKSPKLSHIRTRIDAIINTISLNQEILSKFRLTRGLCDFKSLKERISNLYPFNEYNNKTKLYDLGNTIITYEKNKDTLYKLEINYEANRQKVEEYNKLEKDHQSLLNELQETTDKFNASKKALLLEEGIISNMDILISDLNDRYNAKCKALTLEANIANYDENINNIYSKLEGCSEQMKLITKLQEKLNELEVEKNPLKIDQQKYDNQYNMLINFQTEYSALREEYDYIEKLKNYASPTKGSIQSIYMSMYMDKTLDMANQLLSMIFGGEYRLLDYVITEDEFRIPFVGNGMPVDDISSGSTSQKCIIGMIIDLVLNSIGNSDFGIVTLDEIDGGLDNQNRLLFVDIIQKMRELLGIEQLFIISHSIESSLNNIDVILLSNDQQYLDTFSSANIIWTR